ncbi:prolyl oligopeptidase family serine peptidase [Sediminivirga luteola]|uniref:Dipeptidyl aminopeptidase n=1 Tax=Sediminivirga luteola TaxID=1774748 RepID=A0A8J2TXU8_9MICO|nr:prolyl oligopeptidase family serine peptidase [Sediminivirga luteola]MCI2265834.1 prolyl oligopeptidase family serine peptidase [Sediminivirga luteola]GGA14242.1 dipeptidyl aminopeptidase [Sediminivirga luteola]
MKPADIEKLVTLSRPSLAPDGSFAVVASSRPDLRANRNVGQLWRIELRSPGEGAGSEPAAPAVPPGAPADRPGADGTGVRRLTRGIADASPRLSPDGSLIAFLRPDGRGRPQLHLVEAAGGEPLALTDQPLGVGEFTWSPDGTRLAFLARVPEPGRYGTVEGLGAEAESPRRITGIRWHANGLGYSLDRPAHVFLVDVPDPGCEPSYPAAPAPARPDAPATSTPDAALPSPRALTTGGAEHSSLAFTADGQHVLTARQEFERHARDLRSQLIALPVPAPGADAAAGESVVLGRDAGLSIEEIAVADDGAIVLRAHQPGPSGRDFVAPDVALWLLADLGAEPRRLNDPEHLDAGTPGGPVLPADDDVLVPVLSRGRIHLMRITRDGVVRTVLGGDVEVTGADGVRTASGVRVLASAATPESAGELLLLDLPAAAPEPGEGAAGDAPEPGGAAAATAGSGIADARTSTGEERARVLTDFGAALRQSGVVAPRELVVDGRDGYPVHGWLAMPEGEGSHPVILMIHGGPYHAYGIHVFDEVQTLVGAGYAVAYCNPRGSAGYGRAHGRSIRQAMGTVDYHDVLDFLDGALDAEPRLDRGRQGIMGGSYGGYLTAWTIAHEHRFAGAIVERGFLDPASFQGTSDIGSFFGDEYVGTDPADIARQSPFAVAHQVRTPTLVMHSELDFRCPLEQATRYYTALKRAAVETELLVFPGEDHELTRSGQPRHRLERFEAVLDWWERYLR